MRLTLLMLTTLASGCVSASPEAICAGTRQALADHAAALAVTTDDRAAVTGAALVVQIDAACSGGVL
jgi:hypothetical protein